MYLRRGLLFRGSGVLYLLRSFSFRFTYLALTVAIWWRKPVKAFHLIIVYSTLTWLHDVLAVPLVNAMRKFRSHRLITCVFEWHLASCFLYAPACMDVEWPTRGIRIRIFITNYTTIGAELTCCKTFVCCSLRSQI